MKIVCISDTHNRHRDISVPDGDLLIIAGDISSRGTDHEVKEFNYWLGSMPHKHKIMCCGNHDFGFETHPALFRSLITNAIYLENESCSFGGFKIWGSPVTPWFFDWAFNVHRGSRIANVWDRIPVDTDIVITHGPPVGVLDTTISGDHVGCFDLSLAIERVKPKLHVFGHIHESAGRISLNGTTYINAAQLDHKYVPNGNVQMIDIDP